jgi:hypothetical protein
MVEMDKMKDDKGNLILAFEPVWCGICNRHVPVFRFFPSGEDVALPNKFICRKCLKKDGIKI